MIDGDCDAVRRRVYSIWEMDDADALLDADDLLVVGLRCPCVHVLLGGSTANPDCHTCGGTGRRNVRVVEAAEYDALSDDSARLRELLGDEDPTLRVVNAEAWRLLIDLLRANVKVQTAGSMGDAAVARRLHGHALAACLANDVLRAEVEK